MRKKIILVNIFVALYLSGCTTQNSTPEQKQIVIKSGKVQALKGDDYTHLLTNPSENIKLNSYSVKLNEYEGKNIEVTGEYSGDTLFVDSVDIK